MRNQGLGSWPVRRARMTPDHPAVVHEDGSLTYEELAGRVARLAHALRSLGVGHGDRVAYLGLNHPSLAETLFAAGALGAVFVPLNTRLAPPELAYILRDCEARVLVFGTEHTDVVEVLRDDVTVADCIAVGSPVRERCRSYGELLAGASADPLDEAVEIEEVCMIQYTSGTSGHPKGVMLTHANITWNCFNTLLDVDITTDEVALVAAPMFHTAALNAVFLPTFIKGATSVLMSAFHPDRVFEVIAEHKVTRMFGVPAMFQAIANSPRWADADLSSVRTLICGAAPVPHALIRTYQDRGLTFLQGYGLTETAPGALVLRAKESTVKIGSAGTPCFFTDVRVVHPDLTDVAPGEVGEVIIQGPNVMTGYWQRPDATRAAFYDGGWFRSGDAATVDLDGYVTIVDRFKDMYISGGENVYPAEVEQVIYQHPAVADCAVIGVPDRRWGEVGHAVVVPREGATVTADDILAFLTGRLAKYKIPKTVAFVDALPSNGTGKVLKSRLRHQHGTAHEEGGTR
ncbi:MAG TPA: long-chain fatty acid--CoA ligase [Mycobacterium sp.]|nr:long-chain fatty acid--CoA ligase [Mycobacterium sp.]